MIHIAGFIILKGSEKRSSLESLGSVVYGGPARTGGVE